MRDLPLLRVVSGLLLALGASAGVSCNAVLGGGDRECQNEAGCEDDDPKKPKKPKPLEDTVIKIGGPASPFNPTAEGNMGVKLGPMGGIVLDPGAGMGSSNSTIWVANSQEGTLSKVDTRTMKQLARYTTYPGSVGDPSRTTVSLGGDVVVANRAASNGSAASAVKIAGEKSGCIDRNGNGTIDTFEGEGPVPAAFRWQAGQPESPDECVLWKTDLSMGGTSPYVRAAGFDAEVLDGVLSQYVYIGLYMRQEVLRLDSRTGAIVKRFNVAPTSPYGLVIDKGGNVWVTTLGSGSITKIDVRGGDKITTYSGAKGPPCSYGITADARGFIYTASGQCISRFNPTTETWETFNVPGGQSLRGLAVDQKNNLWVADTSIGMHHIDASPMPPAAGGASTMIFKQTVRTGSSNVGAAMDFDDKPWVISMSGGAGGMGQAIKIDPTTYAPTAVAVGQGPYTYSDMTGYQLRNASRAGIFRHVFKGCAPSVTNWSNLTWKADVPNGTMMSMRYRAAATQADLSSAMWQSVTGVSPHLLALPAMPVANFLQVEISMTAVDVRLTPTLLELAAAYNCKLIVG